MTDNQIVECIFNILVAQHNVNLAVFPKITGNEQALLAHRTFNKFAAEIIEKLKDKLFAMTFAAPTDTETKE